AGEEGARAPSAREGEGARGESAVATSPLTLPLLLNGSLPLPRGERGFFTSSLPRFRHLRGRRERGTMGVRSRRAGQGGRRASVQANDHPKSSGWAPLILDLMPVDRDPAIAREEAMGI